jgi:hypothetical protein
MGLLYLFLQPDILPFPDHGLSAHQPVDAGHDRHSRHVPGHSCSCHLIPLQAQAMSLPVSQTVTSGRLEHSASCSRVRDWNENKCRCVSATGICCEECVIRQFGRCANVIECTYTNRDSTAVFPNLFDVAVPLTSLFISHGTP